MAQRAKRKRGRPVKHGLSRTRAYTHWRWLHYAHTHKRYSRNHYGYEITVSKEWRGIKGLIQFCKDMGEPPEPGARIEFCDITQPASKSNCYWKPRVVQLTPEEVKLSSDRLDFIWEHKYLLTRWELQNVPRIRNYLKSGAPISRQCFNKIEEIYNKVRSALSISRQTGNASPTSTIDNTPSQKLQELEKEKLPTTEERSTKEESWTVDRSSEPFTIIDDYAGGVSPAKWEDVLRGIEEFEARRRLEKAKEETGEGDADRSNRSTGTRDS